MPYVGGQKAWHMARIMRKHQVFVAMKPVKTLRKVLVHPKDKQQKEEITDCVYKIPCGNCDIFDKCYMRDWEKIWHKTEKNIK